MADDRFGPGRHRHRLQPVEHGPGLRQHHLPHDQSEDQDGLGPPNPVFLILLVNVCVV